MKSKKGKRFNVKLTLVVLLMLAFIGIISYGAFFVTKKQTNDNNIVATCFDTSFEEGVSINLPTAYPLSEEEGNATTPYHFKITNKDNKSSASCTVNDKYYVILTVTTGSFNDSYVNYSLNGGASKVLNTADVNTLYPDTTVGTNSYIIDSGILTPGSFKEYDLRLWINSTMDYNTIKTQYGASTPTWSAQLKIVNNATSEQVPTVQTGAQTLIAKANAASVTEYSSGTTTEMYTFTHSGMDSTLATQVSSWTSDEITDYRYIGANPNNYVYFNCTNKSDISTCEVWRIIGVFTVEDKDGNKAQRIKLIRNAIIGGLAWNSTQINNEYVNEWVGGSLYNILNSGDYYTRSNTYASNGLTASARSMINEKAKYYLGGYNQYYNLSGATAYSFERGEARYSNDRSTNVIQEVGIMYPSDFLYTYANGVDINIFNGEYDFYSGNGTPSSGWIYNTNMLANGGGWTISPNSDSNQGVYYITTGFLFSVARISNQSGVQPVVYLNPDVEINKTQGDGSESNPYILSN